MMCGLGTQLVIHESSMTTAASEMYMPQQLEDINTTWNAPMMVLLVVDDKG
jgi:hypothetical protein